jgi:hypothetical protein
MAGSLPDPQNPDELKRHLRGLSGPRAASVSSSSTRSSGGIRGSRRARFVGQHGVDGKEGAAIRAALFKMKNAGRVEVEGEGKYIAVPQA